MNKSSYYSGSMRWKCQRISFRIWEFIGSKTGKMIARIICCDHITTITSPLPNQYSMNMKSYNYEVIYVEEKYMHSLAERLISLENKRGRMG